nr:MAG TPA: LIGANc+ dependent DNA ligase adenylation domain [Caudoviricetes sp.]
MGKKKKTQPEIRIRGTYHLSRAKVEADGVRTLILRRRLQILVHSCIYYVYNDNIVSDSTWSQWARELAELQEKYPSIASRVDYAEEFKGFDGSTGYHLPTRNPEIMSKAQYLLKLHKEDEYGYTGHQANRAKPGSDVIRIKVP